MLNAHRITVSLFLDCQTETPRCTYLTVNSAGWLWDGCSQKETGVAGMGSASTDPLSSPSFSKYTSVVLVIGKKRASHLSWLLKPCVLHTLLTDCSLHSKCRHRTGEAEVRTLPGGPGVTVFWPPARRQPWIGDQPGGSSGAQAGMGSWYPPSRWAAHS